MSYFGSIYADDQLPSRARMVYMYLRDRANQDGICWPSIRTIATDLKLSRSTVKRALRDLEEAGHIHQEQRFRENGGNTSKCFSLLPALKPPIRT